MKIDERKIRFLTLFPFANTRFEFYDRKKRYICVCGGVKGSNFMMLQVDVNLNLLACQKKKEGLHISTAKLPIEASTTDGFCYATFGYGCQPAKSLSCQRKEKEGLYDACVRDTVPGEEFGLMPV